MIKDVNGLIENITTELRKFTDIAVVGLSGGADSTLVSTLCVQAFGANNVLGIHMPYNDIDHQTFNTRSQKLSAKLGIKSHVMPVAGIADAIVGTVSKDLGVCTMLNSGNARSRARMTVLYAVSNCMAEANSGKRVRVIGTGNLSEDYIGYDTKGGDALCDIFPIGELFKSEVYQLLEHFRDKGVISEDHIDRFPSAGLWDGQTDEVELGHSYNAMEPYIKTLRLIPSAELHKVVARDSIEQFVINRHLANKHKHEAPPTLTIRQFCD